jgi:ribosomal protein S18 acetylase RimI-like enzyme
MDTRDTTPKIAFSRLPDDQADVAYRIVCDAVEWLASRGIRQWTHPLPRDEWKKRQHSGENHGLTCDGKLAVVLSLIRETHPYWNQQLGADAHWWLSTVTTAPAFRGRRMGRRAIQEAAAFLRDDGADRLHVDCVHGEGFLPGYYESLGFDLVARRDIEYPLGAFDMVSL